MVKCNQESHGLMVKSELPLGEQQSSYCTEEKLGGKKLANW